MDLKKKSNKTSVGVIKKSGLEKINYKRLYDDSPVLYRTINKEGIVINCNKTYAKSLGYSKDELIGNSIFMTTDENDLDAMKSSFETWRDTGDVKNREVWLKRKDGSRFPTLITAGNVYDDDGILIGSNTVIKDVTRLYESRKKAEKSLIMEIQLQELKKLERLKNEFASMITHELKTPLTAIKGHCDILKELSSNHNLTIDEIDSVNEIHQSATRLDRLIGDVLDAQKLEMGRMNFNYQTFDLKEFMLDVEGSFAKILKEKQIKIVNRAKENLDVYCDKYRLRQVIDNLILNAADFVSPKNGLIEIGAKRTEDNVHFYVKDNGGGIPPDMQPIMFQKFYQADTSPTRKHPGTGLGLVVCKGIIEGLRGEMWFENGTDKGTVFFFTIPLKSEERK